MGALAPRVEQVGFLGDSEDADLQLDMAGDELCINGIRSAATLAFSKNPMQSSWLIATSGYNGPIRCRVFPVSDGYACTIYLTLETKSTSLRPKFHLALFDTIAHFTLRVPALPDARTIDDLAAEARQRPEVRGFPAVGFIPFKQTLKEITIAPVVYTRATNTTVRETACGSGSIAVALHALAPTLTEFRVTQPSGCVYDVSLMRSGSGWIATLDSEITVGPRQTINLPASLVA
jgi:diaminopimelate epimerase